jgi:hypothetical protein
MSAAIWGALISGACTIIVALIYRRVGQVHQLVNSRLDTALEQIEDLKSERQIAREGQTNDPQNRGY